MKCASEMPGRCFVLFVGVFGASVTTVNRRSYLHTNKPCHFYVQEATLVVAYIHHTSSRLHLYIFGVLRRKSSLVQSSVKIVTQENVNGPHSSGIFG
ncbi:hypothetical protein P171DRAFT_251378 [Karstenula rhodostoma CBS 690.94]|uniref:Uncharacterized protein n=1 Tax=Karstenula rhodostoma CBS 690.94 TaxID=1392251 RepID=A0A9P4PLB2_9PLEO|nr:hypothetical protein P171DRAFT_251378 [Karstenula rhodostoma CBS 690.94]